VPKRSCRRFLQAGQMGVAGRNFLFRAGFLAGLVLQEGNQLLGLAHVERFFQDTGRGQPLFLLGSQAQKDLGVADGKAGFAT
jgi:hypothetical protein